MFSVPRRSSHSSEKKASVNSSQISSASLFGYLFQSPQPRTEVIPVLREKAWRTPRKQRTRQRAPGIRSVTEWLPYSMLTFCSQIVDVDHVDHETAIRWFAAYQSSGWATCALTENGLVRVISRRAYRSGQRTTAEGIRTLNDLKNEFAGSHEFWRDEISITETSIFNPGLITGPRQVTDVYLLGLPFHNSGFLLSYDRSLVWKAIRGASADLIHHPEPAIH